MAVNDRCNRCGYVEVIHITKFTKQGSPQTITIPPQCLLMDNALLAAAQMQLSPEPTGCLYYNYPYMQITVEWLDAVRARLVLD